MAIAEFDDDGWLTKHWTYRGRRVVTSKHPRSREWHCISVDGGAGPHLHSDTTKAKDAERQVKEWIREQEKKDD